MAVIVSDSDSDSDEMDFTVAHDFKEGEDSEGADEESVQMAEVSKSNSGEDIDDLCAY